MKKIIILLVALDLIGCTEENKQDVNTDTVSSEIVIPAVSEPVIETSIPAPDVYPPVISESEKEQALIQETVTLLDDKIFWRKATDMKGLTGATFKYNVTTPMDAQRKKWADFKHSEAYKPCEGALAYFTSNTFDAMKNQTDKNSEKMFTVVVAECKTFLKK